MDLCGGARPEVARRDGGAAVNGELVYQALEREIILGHLKPRERLLETDLCLRLGVSRTLLREVFRRLEGAGLVTLQPNRGVVVRDFTPQEVEDVYYLRTALERAAVPLILQRLTAADLKALRAIQRDFERAWRARDMAGMILSNLAFHRRLDEISGNPFLCQSLQVSHLQTQQIRYLAWADAARVRQSIHEHREILSALAQKDAARFARVVEEHLLGGKGDYQRIFPVGDVSGGAQPVERGRSIRRPPPARRARHGGRGHSEGISQ
jgi:DNA-binding GntR family transcriptional regulator